MTPRVFAFMVERHNQRVKREDRRAGEIIAILYNINRDSKEDPSGIDWQDVFTEWKEEPIQQTEDDMYEAVLMWADVTKGLTS